MQLEVGSILEGKVTGITKFGAFVELPGGKVGMVHISEVAPTFVKEIRDFVKEEQVVKVKVLSVGEDGKVSLSMKKAVEQPPRPAGPKVNRNAGSFNANNSTVSRPAANRPGNYEWQASRKNEGGSFEDMLSRFKQSSDEKMSDLKKGMESKRGSGNYARHSGGRER